MATKKYKKGSWFHAIRGSYLPHAWQAWCLFLIATTFAIWPLLYDLRHDTALLPTMSQFVTRLFIIGIILTWIAQKKS